MPLDPPAFLWAYLATAAVVIVAGIGAIILIRTRTWVVAVALYPTLLVTATIALPNAWNQASEVVAQHRAQDHATHIAVLLGASWGAFPDVDARERGEELLDRRTPRVIEEDVANSWYLPTSVELERWWTSDTKTITTCVFVQTNADPDDLAVSVRWCPPHLDGTIDDPSELDGAPL